MKQRFFRLGLATLLGLVSLGSAAAADKPAPSLVCVALMSESDGEYLSARVGKADWKAVKVGDVVPGDAELEVIVESDWAEFTTEKDPTTVYLIEGSGQGTKTVKVADLVKTTPRKVAFPKVSKDTDPAFKDKLVVKQVTGRMVYRANPDTSEKDVHYGDVLDIKGTVRIIGINNPLILAFPNGATTKVIGPLKFEVKKVFEGTSLYKYLNVTK